MRERIVKTTILLRRGTLAEFTEHNPLLKYGEPSFVVDIWKLKIGDGIHCWNDLPYIGGDTSVVKVYQTKEELPQPGVSGILNYIIEDNDIVVWNETTQSYEPMKAHIEYLLQDNYVIFDCGTSTRSIEYGD